MEALLNQYSFVWLALGLIIVAGLVLLTNKPRPRDYAAFGIIVAALLVAWLLLHPRQTPVVSDARSVQAAIGDGRPVLLEFQSPY